MNFAIFRLIYLNKYFNLMHSHSFLDMARNRKKILIPSILIVVTLLSLHSYLVALNAFISPTSDLRWDGTVEYINKPTFSAGDTVTITDFFEQGETYFSKGNYYFFVGSESIRWIAVIKDQNNMPVYIESESIGNASGDITINDITFSLPANAATGTYTVKLMIWTDWLPDGETRTNVIHETIFEVV